MGLRFTETCDTCGASHGLDSLTWEAMVKLMEQLAGRVLAARECIDKRERITVVCPRCEAKNPAAPGVKRFRQ